MMLCQMAHQARQEPATNNPREHEMKRKRFLFVDDNEHILILFKAISAQADIEAQFAASGEEAIGLLKESSFTTMITDLNLPGMNGIELAMIAKNLSPGMDVVMITSKLSPRARLVAEYIGISRVLEKPDCVEELIKIVTG
jgi:DNA-binding NtrC family response regulator